MPRNRNFYSTAENMEGSLALRGDTMPFDPATQHDEDAVMQISTFQNNFVRLRIPAAGPRTAMWASVSMDAGPGAAPARSTFCPHERRKTFMIATNGRRRSPEATAGSASTAFRTLP